MFEELRIYFSYRAVGMISDCDLGFFPVLGASSFAMSGGGFDFNFTLNIESLFTGFGQKRLYGCPGIGLSEGLTEKSSGFFLQLVLLFGSLFTTVFSFCALREEECTTTKS